MTTVQTVGIWCLTVTLEALSVRLASNWRQNEASSLQRTQEIITTKACRNMRWKSVWRVLATSQRKVHSQNARILSSLDGALRDSGVGPLEMHGYYTLPSTVARPKRTTPAQVLGCIVWSISYKHSMHFFMIICNGADNGRPWEDPALSIWRHACASHPIRLAMALPHRHSWSIRFARQQVDYSKVGNWLHQIGIKRC